MASSSSSILDTLSAERAKLEALTAERSRIESEIVAELSRQLRSSRAKPSPASTSEAYDPAAFAAGLRRASLLHQVESDLRFQGDVVRLKDDLNRSLAELRSLESTEIGAKLEGFRTSIEMIQIICSSYRESRAGKARCEGEDPFPFSSATRDFLVSTSQETRRELEAFVARILDEKCKTWPPQIRMAPTASGSSGGEESEGVLRALASEDAGTHRLLTTSLRLLCILQASYTKLFDEPEAPGGASTEATTTAQASPLGPGGEGPQRPFLWMIDPLLDEFKRRVCFHFGQHGENNTFRVDKPDWLLKYGLRAAKVFQAEGKILSSVVDGSGLEEGRTPPSELVLGVAAILCQILPQYLEAASSSSLDADRGDPPASVLLNMAAHLREYDLKLSGVLNPSLLESYYTQDALSPIASWNFGVFISVLLREEYFESWVGAESAFLKEQLEESYSQDDAWDMVAPRTAEQGAEEASGHHIPACVDRLCALLSECLNFSRSFPDEGRRIDFLNILGEQLLDSLLAKLSWKADSYDPYGESSRHLAIQATTTCLISAAFVEESVFDCIAYDARTSTLEAFETGSRAYRNSAKKWTRKLVRLLTKDFEERGVPRLAEAVSAAGGAVGSGGGAILDEFSQILGDFAASARELRTKLSRDVFRTVWTSCASSMSTLLFNRAALGVAHDEEAMETFRNVVSLCSSAIGEYTNRPRSYFKIPMEACEILSLGQDQGQSLVQQMSAMKESESAVMLRETQRIHALTPFQVAQVVSSRDFSR